MRSQREMVERSLVGADHHLGAPRRHHPSETERLRQRVEELERVLGCHERRYVASFQARVYGPQGLL